jgi:hypothetical protein
MKCQVEILDNGNFRPVGNPAEDSEFPTKREAQNWIKQNMKYRADENPKLSDYRITPIK